MSTRRPIHALLLAIIAAAMFAPAAHATDAQNRVRAFSLAAPTHTGPAATENPWTRPATTTRSARFAAGCCVAAKRAERTLGPRFTPGKWLPHFEKHAGEFGYKNSVEYLKGVRDLVGREGVETFTRANGDRLFYDAARNEFAAMRPDGVLRTYFRPKDGADYWRTQIGG
jgi:hypothetical protein